MSPVAAIVALLSVAAPPTADAAALWLQARLDGDLPAEAVASLTRTLAPGGPAADSDRAAYAAAALWTAARSTPAQDPALRDALLAGLRAGSEGARAASVTALAERAAWAGDLDAARDLASYTRSALSAREAIALARGAALIAPGGGSGAAELVGELLRAIPRSETPLAVPVARALLRLPASTRDALLPAAEAVVGLPAALLDVAAAALPRGEAPDPTHAATAQLLGVLSRELDRRGDAYVLPLFAGRDLPALRPRLVGLLAEGPVATRVAAARVVGRLGLEDAVHTLRELFGGLTNAADRHVVSTALLALGSADSAAWLAEELRRSDAPRVDVRTLLRAVDSGQVDLRLLSDRAAARYGLELAALNLARTPTVEHLVALLDALTAADEARGRWVLRWLWDQQRGALITLLGETSAATIDGAGSPVPGLAERADRLIDLLEALVHFGHIDTFDGTPFSLLHAVATDTQAAGRVRHRALLAMMRSGRLNERAAIARDLVGAIAPTRIDTSIDDPDALEVLIDAQLCPQAVGLARAWASRKTARPDRLLAAATTLLACLAGRDGAAEAAAIARRAVAGRGSEADYAALARAAERSGDAALARRAELLGARAAAGGAIFPAGVSR